MVILVVFSSSSSQFQYWMLKWRRRRGCESTMTRTRACKPNKVRDGRQRYVAHRHLARRVSYLCAELIVHNGAVSIRLGASPPSPLLPCSGGGSAGLLQAGGGQPRETCVHSPHTRQ